MHFVIMLRILVPVFVFAMPEVLCQHERISPRDEDNEVFRTSSPTTDSEGKYHAVPRMDAREKLKLWITREALAMKTKNSCAAEVRDSLASLQLELREIKNLLKGQAETLKILSRGQDKLWEDRKRQRKRHVQTKKILKKVYRSCTGKLADESTRGHKREMEPALGDQPQPPVSAQDFSSITPPSDVSQTEVVAETTHPSVPEVQVSSKEPEKEEVVMTILDEEGDTMEVNLTSGVVRGNQTGITWLTSLKSGRSEVCGLQGVLKATFTPPGTGQGREKLMIDLWMEDPTDWVFNVGDSEGNDGRSGDGWLQENDSEAEVKDDGFYVYASDRATNPLEKLLFKGEDFIQGRLTLIVSDEKLNWNNHRGVNRTLSLPSLFALGGQADKQGPINYDIFLGLNRVVSGRYRSGHGLCYMTTAWI